MRKIRFLIFSEVGWRWRVDFGWRGLWAVRGILFIYIFHLLWRCVYVGTKIQGRWDCCWI